MSVREKNGRWIIEIYDPANKGKRHVTQRELRELGLDAPANERQARKAERAVLNARDKRRPDTGDETVDAFAARWPVDYPGRGRGESTRKHNAERVRAFATQHAGRTLRSIDRSEGRRWANQHPSTVMALRAMFFDAKSDGLVDDNPFAALGLEQPKGREDITVLTAEEVEQLADLALQVHGPEFGAEIGALIAWGAYTCARPGESFAARYSLLEGDVYQLHRQFNSRLGKETAPKHDSVGAIYVPEPAQRAVLDKPRRLGDDLIFRTKRGKQFRQGSLHRAWTPIRAAFMATLGPGHHLRARLSVNPEDQLDFYELRHFGASYMLNELGIEPWVIAKQLRHSDDGGLVIKLYGHPTRERAIDAIRRAYTRENVTDITQARQERGTAAL